MNEELMLLISKFGLNFYHPFLPMTIEKRTECIEFFKDQKSLKSTLQSLMIFSFLMEMSAANEKDIEKQEQENDIDSDNDNEHTNAYLYD